MPRICRNGVTPFAFSDLISIFDRLLQKTFSAVYILGLLDHLLAADSVRRPEFAIENACLDGIIDC